MATIEQDFQVRNTYLSNVWYSKLVSTLTKPGALKGVTMQTLPIFIKNITFLTSLEVRHVFIIKYLSYIYIYI